MAGENQENQGVAHGGKRVNAGRPKGSKSVHTRNWLRARGVNPLSAGEILAQVACERDVWRRILASVDDRVVLQAMMFLVSMRDGKPAQSINVTSKSINISAQSIAEARAIIAEIRGPSLGTGEHEAKTVDSKGVSDSLMLRAGEGVEKDG